MFEAPWFLRKVVRDQPQVMFEVGNFAGTVFISENLFCDLPKDFCRKMKAKIQSQPLFTAEAVERAVGKAILDIIREEGN